MILSQISLLGLFVSSALAGPVEPGGMARTASAASSQRDSVVTAIVPPAGATVELTDFARVRFPSGAFDAPQEVNVQATRDAGPREIFDIDAALFHSAPPLGHEIRIATGDVRPATDIEVELAVPEEYAASLPADHTVAVYALIVTGRPVERIERFRRYPSDFDRETRTARAGLPPLVFDDRQRVAGVWEAVVMVGSRIVSD